MHYPSLSLTVGFLFSLLPLCSAGCASVGRELARSESMKAPSSAVIDGSELSLSLELWIESPDEKGRGILAGRATITAVSGAVSPFVDLYHFQLMHGEGIAASLQTYRRDSKGRWSSGIYPPDVYPTVTQTRTPATLVMDFRLADNDRRKPGEYTLAVSLSDVNSKRNILKATASAATR